MDIIFIDELRIPTLIGIYPREQVVPQTLEISLQIGTRSHVVGDDIGSTINYAAVIERLQKELGARHFGLLEGLAEHVAALLIGEFGACWARISIAKIGVVRDVRRVGVVIERGTRE